MQPQEDAHDILARFPGPVTLVPSRRKWLLVLLACAGFTAIAVWMVASGNLMGWFVLAFFGPGAVLAFVALLPGASALKLDQTGFETTNLFRRQSFRWQDASGFEAARVPPSAHNLVVFDHANAAARTIGKLNVGLVGRNAGLPDTYGLSASALAFLMIRWRAQALATARPPSPT